METSTRRAWGNVADQVLLHLRDAGPSTAGELLTAITVNPGNLRQILHRLGEISKRGAQAGQRRIHIKEWVSDAEGQRAYPRPVWAYGHGTNAKKPVPKTNRQAQNDLYWRNKRRVNSVFQLGGLT